jgi:hypothetical protein
MGEDDPLKPDYSRFLKAAKRRNLVSNAVPLMHGHLGSLLHHRARIGERAVIALQVWVIVLIVVLHCVVCAA